MDEHKKIEPEGVEPQPAMRVRRRGQAWQGVRGKMEKGSGAAKGEGNQARKVRYKEIKTIWCSFICVRENNFLLPFCKDKSDPAF